MGFDCYLTIPLARCSPRYKLLLTEVLRYTSDTHPDHADLVKALGTSLLSRLPTISDELCFVCVAMHRARELGRRPHQRGRAETAGSRLVAYPQWHAPDNEATQRYHVLHVRHYVTEPRASGATARAVRWTGDPCATGTLLRSARATDQSGAWIWAIVWLSFIQHARV